MPRPMVDESQPTFAPSEPAPREAEPRIDADSVFAKLKPLDRKNDGRGVRTDAHLLVGAPGTVGQAAAKALSRRHEIVTAGRTCGRRDGGPDERGSVRAMYAKVGKVDAVVACAGHVHFGPVATMTPEQFRKGLERQAHGPGQPGAARHRACQ